MPNGTDVSRELLQLVSAGSASGFPSTPLSTAGRGSEAGAVDAVGELTREIGNLSRQLSASQEAARTQADLMDRNTRAVLGSAASSFAAASPVGVRDGGDLVRRGFGALASPLSGLIGWLANRGNADESSLRLPSYTLPAPVEANLGLPASGSAGLTPVTYSGGGLPRVAAPAAPMPAITVQVQAMDSRSFLDHSDQIARAVREAMLNSHALNDVIGDM